MDVLSDFLSSLSVFIKENATFITAVGFIAALLALRQRLSQSITRLRHWLRNLWYKFTGRPTIPRETMSIVADDHSLRWGETTYYDKPATTFSGDWYITNITNNPVFLLSARIKSPRKARAPGHISLSHEPGASNVPVQTCTLQPADVPARIHIVFIASSAVHQRGKSFKATLVLVDQFSNEHIVKNVVFQPGLR